MAFLSFTPDEEISEINQTELDQTKLIPPGSYLGIIVEAKNVISKIGEPDVFRITWKIEDYKINKRFKLWDTDIKRRMWAQKDLMKLLQILNVKLFNNDKNVDFDTDALIGKVNGLNIKHAVNNKQENYAFVESFFEKAEKKDKLSKLIEDSIDF